MKLQEIETKMGLKIDTETIIVVVRGKAVTAKLAGATLDQNLKPVLSYEADMPKKGQSTTKPAKK